MGFKAWSLGKWSLIGLSYKNTHTNIIQVVPRDSHITSDFSWFTCIKSFYANHTYQLNSNPIYNNLDAWDVRCHILLDVGIAALYNSVATPENSEAADELMLFYCSDETWRWLTYAGRRSCSHGLSSGNASQTWSCVPKRCVMQWA